MIPYYADSIMQPSMEVSQDYVAQLESGKLISTICTLQRAAQAFGVPLEIWFGSQVIPLNDGKM